MKLEYNKEEKEKAKERTAMAEVAAKDLVALNFTIDTKMYAAKEAGTSLGAEVGHINIPRSFTLGSPFQDWTISFCPEEGEFSLGHLVLRCSTEEISSYLELRELTPELVKTILGQPEIRRFSEAAKEGMRKVLQGFESHFGNSIEPFSQEKQEFVRILADKEATIVRMARASANSLGILNQFRWLLPFEIIIGKSTIEKAKESLVMGQVPTR